MGFLELYVSGEVKQFLIIAAMCLATLLPLLINWLATALQSLLERRRDQD